MIVQTVWLRYDIAKMIRIPIINEWPAEYGIQNEMLSNAEAFICRQLPESPKELGYGINLYVNFSHNQMHHAEVGFAFSETPSPKAIRLGHLLPSAPETDYDGVSLLFIELRYAEKTIVTEALLKHGRLSNTARGFEIYSRENTPLDTVAYKKNRKSNLARRIEERPKHRLQLGEAHAKLLRDVVDIEQYR